MKKIKSTITVIVTIIILITSCTKNVHGPSGGDGGGSAPVANFSTSGTAGDAPFKINFSDKSTGGATSWSWDFGDGYTSSEKNPSHIYTKLGRYTVKLTASNVNGYNLKTIINAITVYEIKEYSVPTVGFFYPKRTYGDAEFGGHGPNVIATANLLAPVGGVSGGSESLRLKLTMSAKETVSDWSTAFGEWYVNIINLPSNASFKDFLTNTAYTQSYTDEDHGYVYSKTQIGEIWTMGDTDGDDICSSGCGSGSTHLYFKNFYCKVRIQPK